MPIRGHRVGIVTKTDYFRTNSSRNVNTSDSHAGMLLSGKSCPSSGVLPTGG